MYWWVAMWMIHWQKTWFREFSRHFKNIRYPCWLCFFIFREKNKFLWTKQNRQTLYSGLYSLSLSLKTDWCQIYTSNTRNPAGNQFLKFSHRNTRIKFEISPKLTIKTAEKTSVTPKSVHSLQKLLTRALQKTCCARYFLTYGYNC